MRLADEPRFMLGSIVVEPAARQFFVDGRVITIEPRTMQVLATLARDAGRVVSREALIDACWAGRIVGEDAVNRAILKLRRALEEAGGCAKVETVARVGYRLRLAEEPAGAAPSGATPPSAGRRSLLFGGAALLTATAGGGYLLWSPVRERDARAAQLYDRGEAAFQQGSRDDNAQAIAFFEQAAAMSANDAKIAGALALAYRFEQTFLGPAMIASSTARADRATARALQLDPGNTDAIAAKSLYVPFSNHWLESETRLRAGLRLVPASGVMNAFLGMVMAAVGRTREAITLFDRARADAGLVPILRGYLIQSLFADGRLGDADRELEQAAALWPRTVSLWWLRFWTFALTGRLDAAHAHIAAITAKPLEIGPAHLDAAGKAIVALNTRSPRSIDDALSAWQSLVDKEPSLTRDLIGLAASLGRTGQALAVIERFFAPYFAPKIGSVPGPGFLFGAPLTSLHTEPAFWALCDRIGLGAYWQQSRSRPDIARRR